MSAKTYVLGRRARAFYNGEEFEGVVVGETKNIVVLKTSDGVKKLPKSESVFEIGMVKIDGKTLLGRPYERLLKKRGGR